MTIANKQTYNITFSINREHLLFMCVTLYSLLKNNQQYNFNIYVLHNNCLNNKEIDNITNKHPLNQYNNFKIHLVDCSRIKVLQKITNIKSWPKEIMFKLFIQDFLDVDTILHLDTDIMVRRDISNLFDVKENILFKGINYNIGKKTIPLNFNAGVTFVNLKLAKELNISKKITEFLEKANNIDIPTEEFIIDNLFKEYVDYYEDNLVFNLRKKSDIKNLKYFSKNIIVHLINKPYYLIKGYPNKSLFMEYYNYLQDFIKKDKKIQFRLAIMVSHLFIANYLSIKRRFKKALAKYFKIDITKYLTKGNRYNSFLINKIYKYSIIGKK